MTVQELITHLNNCQQNALVYCGEQGRLACRPVEEVIKCIHQPIVILEYSNIQEGEIV